MTKDRLKDIEYHQTIIDEHIDPESMPVISKTNGIMKAKDIVPIYLRERIEEKKVALSYVIRANVGPAVIRPLENDRITSENYQTLMDDLIDRVPHYEGASYNADNAKVYKILQDMVGSSSHEASIKSFWRVRNGRAAYYSLVQGNIGSSKWDKIIDIFENYLLRNKWNGKNVCLTMKIHVTQYQEAHNRVVRTSQFINNEVLNDFFH